MCIVSFRPRAPGLEERACGCVRFFWRVEIRGDRIGACRESKRHEPHRTAPHRNARDRPNASPAQRTALHRTALPSKRFPLSLSLPVNDSHSSDRQKHTITLRSTIQSLAPYDHHYDHCHHPRFEFSVTSIISLPFVATRGVERSILRVFVSVSRFLTHRRETNWGEQSCWSAHPESNQRTEFDNTVSP